MKLPISSLEVGLHRYAAHNDGFGLIPSVCGFPLGDAPALYIVMKGSLLIYADPEGETYERSAHAATSDHNLSSPRASSASYASFDITDATVVDSTGVFSPDDIEEVPEDHKLYSCRRGNFFGAISMITQEEFDHCARTWAHGTTIVARVDQFLFDQMAMSDTSLVRTLCRNMLSTVSPLVQQVTCPCLRRAARVLFKLRNFHMQSCCLY